jgi:hypothetical protein
MQPITGALSVEQEFQLIVYEQDLEKMNIEDVRKAALDVLRIAMSKENMFREMIRQGLL